MTAMRHPSSVWMRRSAAFDPAAFRLNDEQAALIATRASIGQSVFAGRAATYDREASFPTENYRDLHDAGLLGICIPKKHGGLGADYHTYCTGRRRNRPLLRRDRADLEHACLLDAVVRPAGRRPRHGRRDPRRARAPARAALQAHRRGRRDLFAAVLGGRRGGGRRRRRSAPRRGRSRAAGSSTARRSSPRCPAMPTITACSAPRSRRARSASRRNTLYLAIPAKARRRVGRRRLGSARHARHGLAHAAVQGRVRRRGRGADAARRLFPGGDALAAHVPDAVADLYGPGAGRLRLHRALPARRGAGHAAGQAADVSDQADRGRARCASSSSRPRRSGSRRVTEAARQPDARSRCCAPMPRSTR